MSATVTSAERSQYRGFVENQIQLLAKPSPAILWHYTTGDGLIKIIQTGSLFSTQISCANDTSEFSYARDNILAAFKRKRSTIGNQDAFALLNYIDAYSFPDTSTSEWFITCFSENRDDLSQWRAYGSGENGYSIGFNISAMMPKIISNKCSLVPVHYDLTTHTRLADAVAHATLQFFVQGWESRRSSGITMDQWALSFKAAWIDEMTYLVPPMKHPGFAPECEWRIIHRLQTEDVDQMVYLQKQTLMSRHLPLKYGPADASANSGLLPLNEIIVGPGRRKEVSRISVTDLLRTKKYPEPVISVTMSGIPYQQV